MKKIFAGLVFCAIFFVPSFAYAGNIVDALNLSPFVPLVLDSMMMVATGMYEFFVGAGDGIIYILVWGFLGITITLYLVKMYLPKAWVSFFGFSGGGEIEKGVSGTKIFESILKPGLRAVIAILVLLQLKPVYMTQWLINPFLEFGSIYTSHILVTTNEPGIKATDVSCPPDVLEKKWISPESCEFLVQPVADLSHANNTIIKRGFDFIMNGLRGMITLVPHGGEDFLNLITGLVLVATFFSCNLFMALLVIQGIFNFGVQLILYPFNVLTYVVKPNEKWFDVWPAFSGITKALQQLIITMIACAFILCVNIAVIKALFQWNSSVFVVSAGGSASSNVPSAATATSALGFGQHSVLWLSSILTFYLMYKIFDMTRKQLDMYIGKGMDGLYNKVTKDAKKTWVNTKSNVKTAGEIIGKVKGWIKK